MQNINILVIKHIFQVLAILIFLKHFIYLEHFLFGDPAVAVGDLLEAGDFTMLMILDGLYEVRRFDKALMCAGVEPGEALSEQLDVQSTLFQINAVQVGDLMLAACAWL